LASEPLEKVKKASSPRGVKKTPQSSAVSSHVTLSESAVERSDITQEPTQRADISHTTTTIAKAMVKHIGQKKQK
jgi:hypothetical protein